MKPAPLSVCLWLAGAFALSGCAREAPSAPGLHSITGHARLTGYLVDAAGAFAGTRVVGDADGLLVELVSGSSVVARTATVDGVYRFDGITQGVYVARAGVIGGDRDSTEWLTIAVSSVAVADTLRLASKGDLYPVPNPIGPRTEIYFSLADSQWVAVDILDLSGRRIRSLLLDVLPPGLHSVTWNGRGDDGQMAGAAIYWVTLAAGDDTRAQLLFR